MSNITTKQMLRFLFPSTGKKLILPCVGDGRVWEIFCFLKGTPCQFAKAETWAKGGIKELPFLFVKFACRHVLLEFTLHTLYFNFFFRSSLKGFLPTLTSSSRVSSLTIGKQE